MSLTVTALDPAEILQWMSNTFEVYPDKGLLFWKVPPSNHIRLLGTSAGSLRRTNSGKQYCHIKRNKRGIKRGYLIFLWVNGRWPSPNLDHRDGNSLNDNINNLREATVTQNAWNHHKRSRRIQLPMGVRRVKSGRFAARIGYEKSLIHLGTFETADEARKVYLAKRKELYHEFA